ncbi:LOW QUALITY PROTEIN: UBN2_2 domain-containing protein, partial [Cephalotus follicularis]
IQHDTMCDARAIMLYLRELYGESSRNARFQLTAELFQNGRGASVNNHVLQMINAIEHLAALNIVQDVELSIDLMLHSLPPSYSGFITKFNMNKMKASLADLLNMLREAELNMQKGKAPIISVGPANRLQQGVAAAPVINTEASTSVAKNLEKGPCFHCGQMGYWKRNCPLYLQSIGKGMRYLSFIEINMCLPDSSSLILDSGYGTHICSNMQALQERRKLERGEESLRLADGAIVEAIVVGTVYIFLPSGLSLELKHCIYAP